MKKFLMRLYEEDDGIGTVEIILILVVLIGLVIIFKSQLTSLVNNIFKKIVSQSNRINDVKSMERRQHENVQMQRDNYRILKPDQRFVFVPALYHHGIIQNTGRTGKGCSSIGYGNVFCIWGI